MEKTTREISEQIEQKYDGMTVNIICKWRDSLAKILQKTKNTNPLV